MSWMQTWLVHMRHPLRLLRQLGPSGFLTFQLAVGGNALAALIHPIFFSMLLYSLAAGRPLFGVNGIPEQLTWVFMAALCAGYLVTVIVGLRGLARRRLLSSGWWLGLVLVHWLLLSVAAWRAIIHLLVDPFRWEKTEHGLAKNSRRTDMSAPIAASELADEYADATRASRRDAA